MPRTKSVGTKSPRANKYEKEYETNALRYQAVSRELKTRQVMAETKLMYTWKAFRVGRNNEPRFLFHGVDGDTEVPLDTWIECEMIWVRDGTGGKYYVSGFHSLPDEEAVAAWKGITKKEYPVAAVTVRDSVNKVRSRSKVILSRYLYLSSENWERALSEMEEGSAK